MRPVTNAFRQVAVATALTCASLTASAETIRVQRADIVDRSGFERPMVASSVFVPSGWQSQGGVYWNSQDTCGTGYNLDFTATAPDGSSAVRFMPMQRWQWNSAGNPQPAAIPGCPFLNITSIAQYLEFLVRTSRPGARILDLRPRPDIVEPLKSLNRVTPMPLGEMRAWVEAAEALVGYRENGIEQRETLSVAAVFTLSRIRGGMGMPAVDYLSGAALPAFSMRAPAGQLNFKVAEMIRKSARPNPEWTARITAHDRRIAQMNIQGARDRARITAQTFDEIRQMQRDSWQLQQRSSERNAREVSESIRGVETFDDPYNGGTVELDNTYRYHYQLANGDFVLTDDANFNSYRVFGMDARQLQVTP